MVALTLQGCFTGIESTPKISENDLKRERITERPEQRYVADLSGDSPAQWAKGKQWAVTDSRSDRVFGTDLSGAVIALSGISEVISITGTPEAVLHFDSPVGPVSYRTDISADSLLRRKSLSIPYTVELSVIDSASKRLKGNTYYVNTAVWNDLDGNSIRGLKYIPVEVVDLKPGSGVYPIRLLLAYTAPIAGVKSAPGVVVKGDEGRRYFTLPMSVPGADGGTTRDFADLFCLNDPHRRYPKISDAVWANIMSGRVSEGMTRDECRLAIGAPSELVKQPGYSSLREIWTYPEGIRLVFIDGLLTNAYR